MTTLSYTSLAIIIPIIFLIVLKIVQKLTIGKCRSLACLVGKTAIITGGCNGLGYETALILASRGCRIILADKVDGKQARDKIIKITNNNNIIYKRLDLTSLQCIRRFAKEINATEERLDILINNAGVGASLNKHTDDGLHPTMQVNHFGPFLLTHLLSGLLKKSAPSRIIFVSSIAAFTSNLKLHNLNYPEISQPNSWVKSIMIYGNSKLCNVISAIGFAERLQEYGVTCNSLHPGIVNTAIYSKSFSILGIESLRKFLLPVVLAAYGKTPAEGAQTAATLALSNKLKDVSGKYFVDCKPFIIPPGAWNKKFCSEIWEMSEKLVKLAPEEKL